MKFIRAWLYRLLVEPLLRGIRQQVAELVGDAESCLDIGCGTGALTLLLRQRVGRVVGVDLDADRIVVVQRRLQEEAEFHCADATNLSQFEDGEFDCATISLLLHSVPGDVALAILREAKRVAKKLVIAEFVLPQPRGFWGSLVRWLEFTAGRTHFQSFCAYKRNGGIEQLLKQAELRVDWRVIPPGKTVQVLLVAHR